MGFFSEQDVLLIAGKQAAINTVATDGTVVPIVKGGQGPTHDRNKIDNDARFSDGFEREFALGNHKSGVDLQVVPNLNYIGEPLIGFLGAFTDGVDGALKTHTAKPSKTIIYHTFEESYAGLAAVFYQYFDQVYSEYNFDLDTEGLFKPSFKTVGTGKLVKAVASFDAAPAEVAGAPVELMTWAMLTDDVDEGIVTKMSCQCKREILEARPAKSTGLASELKVGSITITGTLDALFKDDTLWGKARAGTLLKLKATISQLVGVDTYSLEHLFSEVKLVPSSPKKQSGQFVGQSFTFSSIVKSVADSPLKLTLKNGIASHNA